MTGLAGHAFGSWMLSRTHSRTQMWLRDYLPKKISNIKVLIYGYPSGLENSISTISLFEHSKLLKERLLAMRLAAQVSWHESPHNIYTIATVFGAEVIGLVPNAPNHFYRS